jgi:uncharacterized membrane protein YbhN (UPF0104 family)
MRRAICALRVVLAVAIVAALVHWIGPREVWTRLAACPWPVAVAGLAASLLGQWLGAIRFAGLAHTQGLPLTQARALGINVSTVFYSLFLPGGSATGWIVRLLRMPEVNQQLGLALTVIAGDRAFATAAGAALGLAADLALGGPATPAVTLGLVVVAAGAAFFGWALFSPAIAAHVAGWQGVPVLRRLTAKMHGDAFPRQRPAPATVIAAALLSAAVHGLGIGAWFALARALGLDVGLLEITWVRSAALVVGLLPVTVGGLGLREGTVVVLLAGFGVAGADALSLSLLAFTITVLGVGVVGGVAEAARLLRRG